MRDFGVPLYDRVRYVRYINTDKLGNPASMGGAYLGPDVLVAWRADEGEADQEYVSLRVRKRAKSIIILLTSCIPKSKGDGFPIHHDVCRVVIEHYWVGIR